MQIGTLLYERELWVYLWQLVHLRGISRKRESLCKWNHSLISEDGEIASLVISVVEVGSEFCFKNLRTSRTLISENTRSSLSLDNPPASQYSARKLVVMHSIWEVALTGIFKRVYILRTCKVSLADLMWIIYLPWRLNLKKLMSGRRGGGERGSRIWEAMEFFRTFEPMLEIPRNQQKRLISPVPLLIISWQSSALCVGFLKRNGLCRKPSVLTYIYQYSH